nr:CotH kinase family protein [uncultured Flavobacterium sp.]
MKSHPIGFKNVFLLLFISFFIVNCDKDTDDSTVIPSNKITLFRLEDLPEIKLIIPLKDWNTLLSNYDLNSQNDKKVVSSFLFELNGQKVKLDSIGIRLRGNTSRRRPEGNFGEPHNALAPDWHHCHFGLDFAKYIVKQRFSDLEKLNLKWFKDDSNYAREIYSYDLFKRYGIWTAPKASYCKLTITVEGDSKPAYYGVYAMIESIDEDYIANRNANWGSTIGFLWKAGWSGSFNADFVQTSSMGVEDVKLDPSKSKYYAYDLKTRDTELASAKAEITQFIYDLNTRNGDNFKLWIATKMDVPLFLKTYAVNVMVGMWDDYWVNGNNFYFYFAGNGKAYFIPYDYDNTLGTSAIVANSGTQDPLKWGKMNTRPLITKILEIPEYQLQYKAYLKELINPNSDLFDATKSMQRISIWKGLIQSHISNDTGEDMVIEDKPAGWGNNPFYRLQSGNNQGGANGNANYFSTKAKTIIW